MRYLTLALLVVVGALVPALVRSSGGQTPPASMAGSSTSTSTPIIHNPDGVLLVVSANGGLRLSPAGGRDWARPGGLPARGSFYDVVADAARPGRAYTSNGDVFATANGGASWRRLPTPAAGLGPAGVTFLTVDAHSGVLYGASAVVLAYQPGWGQWQVWGRDWPSGVLPAALLTVPDRGLYAAAGGLLYHADGPTAPWRAARASSWQGAPLTALALGPDGATPYLALRGHGVWYTGAAQGLHPLNMEGLPAGDTVYALHGDALGADLYAATEGGLLVRHQPGTDPSSNGNSWSRVAVVGARPVVALRLLHGGHGMLAVARDGALYEGTHTPSRQALTWRRLTARAPLAAADAVVAVLMGAEWHGAALLPHLPDLFTQGCLPHGLAPNQAFDICGPFRVFYLSEGRATVLGAPRGRPIAYHDGSVTQLFDRVKIEWAPGHGTFLAPLGRRWAAMGGRIFAPPTRQVAQRIEQEGSVCLAGYCVDPRFYGKWRTYLDPGGLSIFGPPISQVVYEPGTTGIGGTVPVQYYANARMELPRGGGEPVVSYLPRALGVGGQG